MPSVRYLLILVAIVILAGAVIDYQAVTWARTNHDTTMPMDIHYQVKAHNEPGPNYYYSSNYEAVNPNGFKMDGYWMWNLQFLPLGKHIGGWEYHPDTLMLTDVSPELTVIERSP
jgi:hypothetical protein